MEASKKSSPSFRAAGVSMLVAAATLGPARADTLNLTDAEKTPAKCDVNYKVGDLGGFKAPKAKKLTRSSSRCRCTSPISRG
jgi:hypothetical protein